MDKKHGRRSLPLLAMILLFKALFWTITLLAAGQQDAWTPPVAAMRKTLKVASYRAQLAGDVLLIEVTHEPGWHTYALDNLERAKKKAGEPPLGIEKSTQIEISGGLKVAGKWRQSHPKDLSQPEIKWFTWGFEGTALFAVKVERSGDTKESLIAINGQACKATTCAMIDDLEIRLPLDSGNPGKTSFDLASLIEEGDLTDVRE
jgi:DsbC/DsbD-like thiol-disulfide interchange protein